MVFTLRSKIRENEWQGILQRPESFKMTLSTFCVTEMFVSALLLWQKWEGRNNFQLLEWVRAKKHTLTIQVTSI